MGKLSKEIIMLTILCSMLLHSTYILADSNKAIDLSKLKIMPREEVGELINQYSSSEPCLENLVELLKLLDNTEETQIIDEFSSRIKVRDIALECLGEYIGEDFLMPNKTYPIKAFILYKRKTDDILQRFTIPMISDEEFVHIKLQAIKWIDDFKKHSNNTEETGTDLFLEQPATLLPHCPPRQ